MTIRMLSAKMVRFSRDLNRKWKGRLSTAVEREEAQPVYKSSWGPPWPS